MLSAAVLTQAFFLDLMKDMADENKVEKMVICLKVPETIFISLKRDFHRDTSLLATKVCSNTYITLHKLYRVLCSAIAEGSLLADHQ